MASPIHFRLSSSLFSTHRRQTTSFTRFNTISNIVSSRSTAPLQRLTQVSILTLAINQFSFVRPWDTRPIWPILWFVSLWAGKTHGRKRSSWWLFCPKSSHVHNATNNRPAPCEWIVGSVNKKMLFQLPQIHPHSYSYMRDAGKPGRTLTDGDPCLIDSP